MSDKKYLYYNNHWHGLCRAEIVRETPAYFFIRLGIAGEEKIRKKSMMPVKRDDYTRYEIETPELKDKYEKQEEFKDMINKYHSKLASLQKITDPKIIQEVMEIEL